MNDDEQTSPRNTILRRICLIQVGIIAGGTALLFVMMSRDFGFFWHAFLLGGLGASIALQRNISKKSDEELKFLAGDQIAIAMPVLYGCVMAAVTYGMFMSNLVAGDSSGGLLSSNVFPVFVLLEQPPAEERLKDEDKDDDDDDESPGGEETPGEVVETETAPVTGAETKPETEIKPETDANPETESPAPLATDKEATGETEPASPAKEDTPEETELVSNQEATLDSIDEPANGLRNESGKGVTWADFFRMRPATTEDLGKLFVWCFLAGYSESFVTGLLSRLEQTGSRPAGGNPTESGDLPAAQPANRRKRSS
ncbi:MAG: hypothetical protein O2820_02270 [Planctomycetota bacterium]|nr:hypothetical protein [Planctomycetota bacterium]